jgi:hypothetical protein
MLGQYFCQIDISKTFIFSSNRIIRCEADIYHNHDPDHPFARWYNFFPDILAQEYDIVARGANKGKSR